VRPLAGPEVVRPMLTRDAVGMLAARFRVTLDEFVGALNSDGGIPTPQRQAAFEDLLAVERDIKSNGIGAEVQRLYPESAVEFRQLFGREVGGKYE
jgi:hypothetical protein